MFRRGWFCIFCIFMQACILNQAKKQENRKEKPPPRSWPITYVKGKLDEIVVVNLDRDTERLKKMQVQLDQRSLPFTRFPAIYGKNYKFDPTSTQLQILDENKNYSYQCDPKLPYKGLTPGEVGNRLSHYEVAKKVIEKNQNAVLVFEDDVELPEDFSSRLDDVLNHLPENWDLVYLYCNSQYSWGCYEKNLAKTQDGRYIFLGTSCDAGNVAYLINAKSAKKINDKIMPMKNIATDTFLGVTFFTDNNFYAYCLNPEMIQTSIDPSLSTIDQMGRRAKAVKSCQLK